MTYSIQGGRPDPTLEYDVTDAATGAPMRVTIAGGVIALAYAHGAFRVNTSMAADKRQQLGFFVPGMQPLPAGPDPVIVSEMSLSQVGVFMTDIKTTRMHGVIEVNAQAAPDPHGQRLVYLSFTAVGTDPMTLRYRLTLYRPRG